MNIQNLKKLPRVGQLSTPANQATSFNVINSNAALQSQINSLAEQRAQEIIREQQQSQILARNGRTFTKFDRANDVIDNQTEVVTAGLWSDGLASLTTHFTGSSQTTSQRRYYVDVYQKNTSETGAAVQYSIAYGHALGSGSDSQGQLNDSPSRAIYSQYKQLLLESSDTRFTVNGTDTDSIYVINFSRARTKEKLDPGNFELPLISLTSRNTNATGSVVTGSTVFTLIDDSGNSGAPTVGSSGRVFNIVSGSINNGIYNSTSPVYYGLVYPDYGVMILNAQTLDANLSFLTNTGSSSEGNNHFAMYHSISGSATKTNPATSDPYGFSARNAETITSTHYFVRIKNAEYNFSNNPSFTTGSVGEFRQSTFLGDPKTYITTIGMYSDQRELLAVAKLSQPLLKSFKNEALIRVKLDF
tara:strand:- start:2705 stop:3952 length:1248 start_codon:yes stop_codon:yes gene_type:complete